jgi:hypothetical protein
MGINRGYTIDFHIVKGILIAILMVMVAFSGCIEDTDEDRQGPGSDDATSPPEERLILKIEYVNQSDVNCWDTTVTIYNPTDNEYFLNDVTLSAIDTEGNPLTNAILTYLDLDADNLISNSDIIEVTNMTDAYQGSSIRLDYQGQFVRGVGITWEIEDSYRYMVRYYQMNTTQIDDIHWNSYFHIASIRGDNPITISDISIAIQKDENTILTSATVYVNDTDGDGILSESDKIEITSMTEKYRGSAVRLIINDFQVGYNTIYYFNLEGDTEGGIRGKSQR